MKKNYVEDLLTKKELKKYRNSNNHDAVTILNTALKNKLKTDPAYEVWVQMEYVRYKVFDEEGEPVNIMVKYLMVNNKGDLYYIKPQPQKIRVYDKDGANNKRYPVLFLMLDTKQIRPAIHRIVATSFIPIPKELENYGHSLLEVNHIDGVKSNSDFTNLEWVTSVMNVQHAHATGLIPKQFRLDHWRTAPILGEVIVEGSYKGFKFIRSGDEELIWLLGRSNANVYSCCKGLRNNAKGCKWKYATGKEFEKYGGVIIPEDLRILIRSYHGKKTGPYLCTRISDNHRFILHSSFDAKKHGFKIDKITMCIQGKRNIHAGHRFKLLTYKELLRWEKELEQK